jgi:hypothetical protein
LSYEAVYVHGKVGEKAKETGEGEEGKVENKEKTSRKKTELTKLETRRQNWRPDNNEEGN